MSRIFSKILDEHQVLRNANIPSCNYVLAVNYCENDAERYKARFVLDCHCDRHKAFLAHTLQTVQTSSTRFMLARPDTKRSSLLFVDALQAYTQMDKSLVRLVIIDNVPSESKIKNDECV